MVLRWLWQHKKQLAKYAALTAAITAYTFSQKPTLEREYHKLFPSEIRTEFYEEHGIRLDGPRSEIEEQPEAINKLSLALKEHGSWGEYEIQEINLEADNFWNNPSWDQALIALGVGKRSYSNPLNDHLTLRSTDQSTITHEVAHARTWHAVKQDPNMLHEWRAISGEEHYKPLAIEFITYLPFFESNDTTTTAQLKDAGFVSKYASSNTFEDIAETAEYALRRSPSLVSTTVQKYDKIAQKISLLAEHEIVPQELPSFIKLYGQGREAHYPAHTHSWYLQEELAKEYLPRSEEWLAQHPNSKYAAEVHAQRARMYRDDWREELSADSDARAIEEFKHALRSANKEQWINYDILHQLRRLDTPHWEEYSRAIELDDQAIQNGTKSAATTYLIQEGVL